MFKAILFGRECTQHPSNTIVFVCLSKDCQKNRLLQTHNDHKEILNSDKFDELLEKLESGIESFHIKFDHMLEELRVDFEKLFKKCLKDTIYQQKNLKIQCIKELTNNIDADEDLSNKVKDNQMMQNQNYNNDGKPKT